MKRLNRVWIVYLVTLLAFSERTDAQFYGPQTEFHDKAQRLFAVETARMLAWRENQSGPKIREISYKVSVGNASTNKMTTWDLNFLDGNSNSVKTIQVSYPESLLSEGPRYYREVFKQIWSQGRWSALTNLSGEDLNARFWQGAELNGPAREEGLRVAFKLTGTKPSVSESEYAPKLAGLLVHIPMPSLCGGLTLDAMLLARGAAWLALSETMLKEPASAADENWAPIMFMAGREYIACQLWKNSTRIPQKPENRATLFQWWNFFVRRPHAREVFEFVADAKQRRFGMPMMTYYSRLDYLGSPLSEVLVPLYGSDKKTLTGLYNYGGFLSASTDVGGGRLFEGAWPAIFRSEWLKLLNDFPVSATDYIGYADKLKEARKLPDPLEQPDENDASLTGLKQAAPLLELGYEQGTGKLTPVASVTARDLLNYGWEMNALQMGARYYFVKQMWGIPDLAEMIFKRATLDIQGQMPFFPDEKMQTQTFNLQDTLYRLQLVDDLGWRVKVNIQPFAKDATDTNGARQFYQSCWLRPYETRWQAWLLWKAGLCDEMSGVLRRYHNEGGPKSDILALEWIQDWYSAKDLETLTELKNLKEEIAEGMIDPTSLQVKALYQKRYAPLGNAARSQAYEKLFWRNPDSGLEQDILNGYIFSGAWKSAKRFYKQARDTVSRNVGFSNFVSPQMWMLGFLEGDEDLMNLALEDDTGSYFSMMTTVWHSTSHDQFKKVEQQLSALVERYESEQGPRSVGRTMKGFLPLLPALKDAKHSQHEEALDYFGKSDTAVIFRWILIQKYKLSAPDAIRFLGGKETDRLRRVLLLYLENERGQSIRDALTDYIQNNSGNKGAGRPLASWAAGQTKNRPKEIEELDEKDLKPAGAQSIRHAVLEKLHQN